VLVGGGGGITSVRLAPAMLATACEAAERMAKDCG